MTIKTYSVKMQRNTQLSPNFKVYEFKCSDGIDSVPIDDALVIVLQKIRDHFAAPVNIHSGYRTQEYNKKIGGSPNSQHLKGTAADIDVSKVAHVTVAQYAETLGVSGIGLYPWGVHVDTRAGKARWDSRSGKEVAVSTFGGKTFAQKVQEAAKLEASTMTYLTQYKYGAALIEKLAAAIHYMEPTKSGQTVAQQVQTKAKLDDNTMAYLKQYKYAESLLEKLAQAMR